MDTDYVIDALRKTEISVLEILDRLYKQDPELAHDFIKERLEELKEEDV